MKPRSPRAFSTAAPAAKQASLESVSAPAPAPAPETSLAGLSSLRAVLAFWVVADHADLLSPLRNAVGSSLWKSFWGVVVCSPAAVIGFFIISGACIHFPYCKGGTAIDWPKYFARRYLRILPPAVAIVALCRAVGYDFPVLGNWVLWSILCELVYYAAYPLLLAARTRWGWGRVLSVSYAAAVAVIASDPTAGNYHSYGDLWNPILGLPCWLLGCLLVERDLSAPVPGRGEMWAWRLGIWATSSLCLALRFHTPIGYPVTMTVFAPLMFVWIEREIRYHRKVAPIRFLERAGGMSYSLYLVHSVAVYLPILWGLVPHGGVPWGLRLGFALGFSSLFYLVVERPSHQLSRRVGRS